MPRVMPCVLCVLQACVGATSDPGLDAVMQVDGAQFVRSPVPHDDGGPRVVAAALDHSVVQPGTSGERCFGSLDTEATAVLLTWPGDVGYWVLPALAPRVEEPTLPSFEARLAFARDAPDGLAAIVLHAVDRLGRIGPEQRVVIAVAAVDTNASLIVSLDWDVDADLDLHVTQPDGIEVWAGNINSYRAPTPGQAPGDPNAFRAGGMLDFDSNSDCVIDGRRRENVIYQQPAPSGRYVVRVATSSMCETASVRFAVKATFEGEALATASGTRVAADLREVERAGAGLTVLTFDVP